MATENIEGEGEEVGNSHRLHSFLSSILNSLGGVFGQININQVDKEQDQEEEDTEMDNNKKVVAVVPHNLPRGLNEIFVYPFFLCFSSDF